MAVSKQIKDREGIQALWRKFARPAKTNKQQDLLRAAALRNRRSGPGGDPGKAPDEGDQQGSRQVLFGVGVVAVVTVLSLVAYRYDIPQLFPLLGAGVGAIAGFWLFAEVRRLF